MEGQQLGLDHLLEILRENSITSKPDAREFFRYVRSRYLEEHGVQSEDYFLNAIALDALLVDVAHKLRISPADVWGSDEFQLAYRSTKPEHLAFLGLSDGVIAIAKEAVTAGRMMSVLPYNTSFSEETLRKFLPSNPITFSGKYRLSMDPYGIFSSMSQIVALDSEGKSRYIGSRKFPYAVLFNATDLCFVGCDGCYKGALTRTSKSALSDVSEQLAAIKSDLVYDEAEAATRAHLLTLWLNQNREVNTVIISGGEPTLFSNFGLENILNEFSKAEHVKVVRMCTSSVFQGMWYRIDDGFTNLINQFCEKTGKQFYINAHVTDEYQLSAPEAKMAVKKLNGSGISVHLQMPLMEGINFKRGYVYESWSAEKLLEISSQAYLLGVNPYVAIVDMHSSSDPYWTVPIESVSKVISCLDSHDTHSNMERWKAVQVLHPQGNFYVYPYPHFSAKKIIDYDNDLVTYFIPKFDPISGQASIHTYEEPLLYRINDDPDSLNILRLSFAHEKVQEVSKAYRRLKSNVRKIEKREVTYEARVNQIAVLEHEYNRISGINFPENKPLRLDSL